MKNNLEMMELNIKKNYLKKNKQRLLKNLDSKSVYKKEEEKKLIKNNNNNSRNPYIKLNVNNIKPTKNKSFIIYRSSNILINLMKSNEKNNENYHHYSPVCKPKIIQRICNYHFEKNPKKHKRNNSQFNLRNNNNF